MSEIRLEIEGCQLCGRGVLRALSANGLPIFLNPIPLKGYWIDTDGPVPPRVELSEMWIDHTTTCRGVDER